MRDRTCVSRLCAWIRFVVIGSMEVLIGTAIGAKVHVFVGVVSAAVAVRYARRGIMEWAIISGRARENGTELGDASEDVGRKGRGRILDTMRLGMMMMMVVGVMMMPPKGILSVDGRATPAGRLSLHGTVAGFTLGASTAARRRFTFVKSQYCRWGW